MAAKCSTALEPHRDVSRRAQPAFEGASDDIGCQKKGGPAEPAKKNLCAARPASSL